MPRQVTRLKEGPVRTTQVFLAWSEPSYFLHGLYHIWNEPLKSESCLSGRHLPGSQPSFSLIPDPDQNLGRCINYFCCSLWRSYPPFTSDSNVLYQTKISRKMSKILQILRNPGSRIRVCFYRFSLGSNHFIKEIHCHIKQHDIDNPAQYSEVP